MRVIPPLAITDAILTSSSASEPLAPSAYSGATTYALADFVLVAADHMLYQSLQGSNLNHTPNISPLWWEPVGYIEAAWAGGTTYAANDTVSYSHIIYLSLQGSNTGNNPLISPLYWVEAGATNRWRSLDVGRNTATVAASPLTIVLTPGRRVNSIALLGLIADSVRVQVTSVAAGGGVFDETFDLSTRIVVDWYDYFYAAFTVKQSVVSFDLPPYTDMIITVTITRGSGFNVECGSLVVGTFVDLGKTQYSAENDTLNFSTIDRDSFGNSILIPRRNVPKTNSEVWADAGRIDRIRDVRSTLNAVPAVWCGLDDSDAIFFEALLILGVYKRFTINMQYQDKIVLTLELEEI